jgi:hypothetical protein
MGMISGHVLSMFCVCFIIGVLTCVLFNLPAIAIIVFIIAAVGVVIEALNIAKEMKR